ncbi:Protein of unknown function [Bacillus cytotoxicus]|uniref:Uncharacterized protein n=1 Tax=Bacillus cytotoxicus TaxID=580165 RepID=A0AAX2CIN6_9BACI|nr:Protein of unknown function [Bacillus cytotoxicus]SCN39423.1 Protein of unknown function [Bacillus cytotoxicus]
MGREVRHMEI